MKRHLALAALSCALIALLTPETRAAVGDTESVLSLAAGNRPEGIAVHQTGNVFVGNRRIGGAVTFNEILKITPDANTVVFARLPDTRPAAEGLLGLTVDRVGNLYAALVSFDGNHGVWKVS